MFTEGALYAKSKKNCKKILRSFAQRSKRRNRGGDDTALNHYLEDCHHLAYTHTIKAESINEKYFKNREIFGLIYYIEGNTASSTQFFITDSTRHFLRGALYFNQHPDKDSLAPVIDYLREDIVTLMETLRFKNK